MAARSFTGNASFSTCASGRIRTSYDITPM
jgi:hypothetical protein